MTTTINDEGVVFPDGRTQPWNGPWLHSQNGYEGVGQTWIQWGRVSSTASSVTVNFYHEIKYPTVMTMGTITSGTHTGGSDTVDALTTQGITQTSFTVSHNTALNGFYWVAIGRVASSSP